MTNGHGNETPANKIATARATLGLAIRLLGEVEAGRITTDIFKHSVTVQTGGDSLILPPLLEGTDQDLKYNIFNIVLIALGASALTLDDTLEKGSGTELNTGIRIMVHQLRNTFAHNPLRPKWDIPERYRKSYPIELDDGSKFTFDATNLHGRVEPEHVGDLGFWGKLLRHYERLVGGCGDSHAS